jgi:hypothetical protein
MEKERRAVEEKQREVREGKERRREETGRCNGNGG